MECFLEISRGTVIGIWFGSGSDHPCSISYHGMQSCCLNYTFNCFTCNSNAAQSFPSQESCRDITKCDGNSVLFLSSLFDREFTGTGYIDDRLSFRGKYQFTISWSEEAMHWHMTSPRLPHVWAIFNKSVEYPLGYREWVIFNDTCQDWHTVTTRNLTLTSCLGETFACGDGTCVAMEHRYVTFEVLGTLVRFPAANKARQVRSD